MLTPYTPAEHAKRLASLNLPSFPREVESPRHGFENDSRRRVRLSAERSRRKAAALDAYIAKRERAIADAALADVSDHDLALGQGRN